jgi:L-threonylcarbamoyladenylate synthase
LSVIRYIEKNTMSEKAILEVSSALRAGRLVILPATSGYVLACDANNYSAIEDINLIRENKEQYILSMIFPSIKAMDNEVTLPELEEEVHGLIESGQLTLILKRDASLRVVHGSRDELVTVNIPASENIKKLLRVSGPCVIASASKIGSGIPTSIADISNKIKSSSEYILDSGKIIGKVSSVIDFTSRTPTISRIGAVSKEKLQDYISMI